MEKGLVIKSTGSWYTVRREDGTFLECRIKGKFRMKDLRTTNPVAVGDRVLFTLEKTRTTGVITSICDRSNYIIRRASKLSSDSQIIAANIDQAFLIVTLAFPETPLEFIDRFLVSAEAYRIPVRIIINKSDLFDEPTAEKVRELAEMYERTGYPCLITSAVKQTNIDKFASALRDKVNVLSGKSGVGKSSLINAVDPGLMLRTEEISSFHRSGKHTTAFAEMFALAFGGYIIDTPGIKGFGMIDMEKEEIYHFFPEIFKISSHCKYYNCLHIHEPECAVIRAVKDGMISESRYRNYIRILLDQDQKYRR